MALFNRDGLISRAREDIRRANFRYDSAGELRKAASVPEAERFDIFLCHSSLDAEIIHGLVLRLREAGLRVYVDWIVDPQLDRSNVTPETADHLRRRMRSCHSLLYAASANASNSKWTPWELGYGDGVHQRVGIIPITAQATTSNSYQGQEYLGLYPYVVDGQKLGVHFSSYSFVQLDDWLFRGAKPIR